MSLPHSSARLSQNVQTAPLLASQKTPQLPIVPTSLASQNASIWTAKPAQPLASQKSRRGAVKVTASKGKGQDSKTIKVDSLAFRVRLNDRGYRVMLLPQDHYLVSLLSSEWTTVESDKAAFVCLVKEKLRTRIDSAKDEQRDKLRALLTTIGG